MTIKTRFVAQTGTGASDAIDIFDTNSIRVSYAVSLSGSATSQVPH